MSPFWQGIYFALTSAVIWGSDFGEKMLLNIQNLTKFYGTKLALDSVSLNLQEGNIVGLLGPNGSGKTTLIKVLLGLLKRYSGEVKFCGELINDMTKAHIAYLPDKNHIPLHWNLKEAFEFFGDFFGDFDYERAGDLSERLKLDTTSKIKTFSKGNKEKAALLLTLARKARLYIFDEPIAGVDPVAREEIFSLIMKYCKKDTSLESLPNSPNSAQSSKDYNPSVLIATHLIYDVEQILDEAIFLSYGKVLAHKSVEDFTRNGRENPINLEQAFKEAF